MWFQTHERRASAAATAAISLCLFAAATVCARRADAIVVNMRATLSGTHVVPPNASPATGSATIRIDTQINALLYHITYSGLTSAETVSFIHGYAPPGMNAGNRHVLPVGTPKLATWIYPEAEEAQILAGNAYVLIHTTMFPAGEIRGQIVPALPPEGSDMYDVTAQIQLDLYGIGATTLMVSGPMVIRRGEPAPAGAGEVQTAEILSLQWTGANPLLGAVTVRKSALYATSGSILSAPSTAFPATSTFDTFIEIVTASDTFFNRNRLRTTSTIHAIPPIGDTYSAADVLLYRDGTNEGTIAGRIVSLTMTPNAPFVALPPPGTDCLDTELHMQVTINGTGIEHVIGLGPLMLTRGAAVDPGDGRSEVPLEVVAMNHGGTGKIIGEFNVVEVAAQASTGIAKSSFAGVPFPVDVDLDTHIEIQLPTLGRTLVPQVPPHVHGPWNALPQLGFAIDGNNLPIVLLDKITGLPAGSLDFFYLVPDSVCVVAPQPAVELFNASGSAMIELFGSGTASVAVTGSGIDVRGPGRDAGGGTLTLDTELRSLVLAGNTAPVGAITLREDPARASVGHVTGNTIGALLPAAVGYSAFISVQTTNGVLRPAAAVSLAATAPVTTLPLQAGTTFALIGGPVDLRNASGITRGRLLAWTLVLGTTTPWPTDVEPPPANDTAADAVLASVALERNPFRGAARFQMVLDRARRVNVDIYDVRGAHIRSESHDAGAGGFVVEWNGRDSAGRQIGAGLYFYRIAIDGRVRSGKFIRLR